MRERLEIGRYSLRLVISQGRFLEDRGCYCFFKNRMKLSRDKRNTNMLMTVGMRTKAQDLTSHVRIGSELHCLLGQL